MKGAIAVCIISFLFLAASSHKLPEEKYKVGDLVEAQLKANAEEAIFVGHILREAARQITQSHEEDDESEEYFWRGFWEKVKLALITAAQKVKVILMKAGKELFQTVKEVAFSAAEAALEAATQKALQKAIEIVDKMTENSEASYSIVGSEKHADFITHFCERMELIGKHLIEEGEKQRSQ